MGQSITTEPYGSVAEIAFWPLLLLLIFLGWRFRTNRIVKIGCALAALTIVLIGMSHDLFSGSTSLAAVHDIEIAEFIVFAPVFVLFAAMAIDGAKGGWKREDRFLGLFIIGVALGSFLGFASAILTVAMDLALPWHVVEGEVTALKATWRPWGHISWKALGPNFVHIGDSRVQASTPLYRTLRVGEHVRVEVSRGSDFIRRIERVGTPRLDRS